MYSYTIKRSMHVVSFQILKVNSVTIFDFAVREEMLICHWEMYSTDR